MASRTVLLLEDDIDGSQADQTVSFGIDGATYEIDLNEANAEKLRNAVAEFVGHARRIRGSRQTHASSRSAAVSPAAVDNQAVRAWAKSRGIEVSRHGRIPAGIVEQYRAAGN